MDYMFRYPHFRLPSWTEAVAGTLNLGHLFINILYNSFHPHKQTRAEEIVDQGCGKTILTGAKEITIYLQFPKVWTVDKKVDILYSAFIIII